MEMAFRRNGFPMIKLPSARRREDFGALQRGQVDGDRRPFVDLLLDVYGTSRLRF